MQKRRQREGTLVPEAPGPSPVISPAQDVPGGPTKPKEGRLSHLGGALGGPRPKETVLSTDLPSSLQRPSGGGCERLNRRHNF